MNKQNKQVSTVTEAADIMGVTPAYVRDILNRAKADDTIKIKGTKIGKAWRIDTQSIYEYLGLANRNSNFEKDEYIRTLERQVQTYMCEVEQYKNRLNMILSLATINKIDYIEE